MRRFRPFLTALIVATGLIARVAAVGASDGAVIDDCCDEAFGSLLQAQSETTRDRFTQLRLKLAKLDQDDFTWLQITAASEEPICAVMECNGVAESVTRKLIALQVIEREAAAASMLVAQDRRLSFIVTVMTVISTIIALGSLWIAFLRHSRSKIAESSNA
jgi:hypothetical protein